MCGLYSDEGFPNNIKLFVKRPYARSFNEIHLLFLDGLIDVFRKASRRGATSRRAPANLAEMMLEPRGGKLSDQKGPCALDADWTRADAHPLKGRSQPWEAGKGRGRLCKHSTNIPPVIIISSCLLEQSGGGPSAGTAEGEGHLTPLQTVSRSLAPPTHPPFASSALPSPLFYSCSSATVAPAPARPSRSCKADRPSARPTSCPLPFLQ